MTIAMSRPKNLRELPKNIMYGHQSHIDGTIVSRTYHTPPRLRKPPSTYTIEFYTRTKDTDVRYYQYSLRCGFYVCVGNVPHCTKVGKLLNLSLTSLIYIKNEK